MSELIRIEFPDGKSKEYPKGIRPNDILKELGRSLAEKTLAAKFNDKVVDLDRPLQNDGRIRFLVWDDPEGKEVYWHSTSHIMAHAIKELYPEAQFGVARRLKTVSIMTSM